MSYHSDNQPPVLIARRGYSDLGNAFFGSFGSSTPLPQQPSVTLPAAPDPQKASGSSGALSTIGGVASALFGGIATSYGQARGVGVPPPYMPPPSPLVPILVIGGLGLAAVLLLRRPARSNPARRRGRRRTRR